MREFERLMPTLDPPPGGLSRLQRGIASRQGRLHVRWQHWAWVAAVVCVPIAILAAWTPQWIAQQQQTAALTAALRQGLSPRLRTDGIVVAHGAAMELPNGQANVRLYLVQTARPIAHKQ